MKRILPLLIAATVCCAIVSSCASNTARPQSAVTMQITPDEYDVVPLSVKLTIVNHSDTVAEYGAPYSIEQYKNGQWTEMPFSEGIGFIDIMYALPARETREYDISLFPDLAQYTPGLYRVRKDNINVGSQTMSAVAEFRIR